jgi:peroxiredoxin family protein
MAKSIDRNIENTLNWLLQPNNSIPEYVFETFKGLMELNKKHMKYIIDLINVVEKLALEFVKITPSKQVQFDVLKKSIDDLVLFIKETEFMVDDENTKIKIDEDIKKIIERIERDMKHE